MWRRPRSSTFIAVLKPCPSRAGPPMMASAGTRTSSKITSQVCAPFWPIFLSGRAERDPRRLRRDQESADAERVGAVRVGTGKDREEPGRRRVGDEALGAVDHVGVVA